MYIINANRAGLGDSEVETIAQQLFAQLENEAELIAVRGSVEVAPSNDPAVLLEQTLELQKSVAFRCLVSYWSTVQYRASNIYSGIVRLGEIPIAVELKLTICSLTLGRALEIFQGYHKMLKDNRFGLSLGAWQPPAYSDDKLECQWVTRGAWGNLPRSTQARATGP